MQGERKKENDFRGWWWDPIVEAVIVFVMHLSWKFELCGLDIVERLAKSNYQKLISCNCSHEIPAGAMLPHLEPSCSSHSVSSCFCGCFTIRSECRPCGPFPQRASFQHPTNKWRPAAAREYPRTLGKRLEQQTWFKLHNQVFATRCHGLVFLLARSGFILKVFSSWIWSYFALLVFGLDPLFLITLI